MSVDTSVDGGETRMESSPRVTGKTWFIVALLVLSIAYLVLGFDLAWRTRTNGIGPGFFPRIIGGLMVAITLYALIRNLVWPSRDTGDSFVPEVPEEDHGLHPGLTVKFLGLAAALTFVMPVLGATLSTALFLAVTIAMLDPMHRVRAVVIAIGTATVLHLTFITALGASLPRGIFENF